jgi:predicted transcriptional regulator
MKKEEKRQRIKDFSDYIENGQNEVSKDFNIDLDVTTIYKSRTGKMPDSVFVLQDFALKLAIRGVYNLITYRILFYFIAVSQYENFISADVKTIAEDLNISVPSVKRATKQLTDDNIIMKIEHPKDKRRIDYFLNPKATWRGKTMNRDKFIDKAKKNKLQLELFKE